MENLNNEPYNPFEEGNPSTDPNARIIGDSDDIELKDLSNNLDLEKDDDNIDTSFTESEGSLESFESIGLNTEPRHVIEIDYSKKSSEYNIKTKNISYLITDKLLMEKECSNPKFIKYLIEKQDFEIIKIGDGEIGNYEFEYYGEPFFNEYSVKVRPVRKFKTTNGEIADQNEMNQIVNDIRYHYDTWKKNRIE